MKKKDHQQFVRQVEASLVELGAVRTEQWAYDWRIETIHGPLLVSVDNRESVFQPGNSTCFWPDITCRFPESSPDFASRSGKWNFVNGEQPASEIPIIVADFIGRLERIVQPQQQPA